MSAPHPQNDLPLMFPVLAPLYGKVQDLACTMLRVTTGGVMSWFGWEKLFNGDMPRDIELFQNLGLEPAVPLAEHSETDQVSPGFALTTRE